MMMLPKMPEKAIGPLHHQLICLLSLLLYCITSIVKGINNTNSVFLLCKERLKSTMFEIVWQHYLAAGLVLFWFFLLRPRGGGKDSPPLVTSSTVVRIPLVGVIAEFLKNPNEMMTRCYKDYGQIFTIPVS